MNTFFIKKGTFLKEIDVFDSISFPFVLRKTFTSNDLSQRGGTSSYTFELPTTKKNLEALDITYNIKQVARFYSNPIEFFVKSSELIVFSGIIKITSVGKEKISCFAAGNDVSWIQLIGDKSLNDLQIDGIVFEGGETVLQIMNDQAANVGNHCYNSFICFPFVTYGTYYMQYNEKKTKYLDTSDYRSLIDNPSFLIGGFELDNSDVPHISYQDVPPAYYLTRIIRSMFENIGWCVGGKWIDSDHACRLILPTVKEGIVNYNHKNMTRVNYFHISSTQIIFTNNPSGAPFPPPPAHDYQDSNGFQYLYPVRRDYKVNGSSAYTFTDKGTNCANEKIFADFYVPEDGIYQFSFNYNGSYTYSAFVSPLVSFYYPILGFFFIDTDADDTPDIIEDTSFVLTSGGQTFRKMNPLEERCLSDLNGNLETYRTIILDPNNGGLNVAFAGLQTFQSELKKGDVVRFLIIHGKSETLNATGLTFNNLSYLITNISGDQLFQVAKNLPKISQINLLKSVLVAENLFFQTDDLNKVIYFDKYEDFYSKVPLYFENISGQPVFMPNELPSKLIISFKEDTKDYNPINTKESIEIEGQQIETSDLQLIFADSNTEVFKTVINTNKAGANYTISELQNPISRELNRFTSLHIATESAQNSAQFGDLYIGWSYAFQVRLAKIKGVYNIDSFFRLYDNTLTLDKLTQGLKYYSVEPYKLDITSLLAQLEAMKKGEKISLPCRMNLITFSSLNSNTTILINGIVYRIESIGSFKVLSGVDIVELNLIRL